MQSQAKISVAKTAIQADTISKVEKLSLLSKMLRVREVEERIVKLYPEQEMRCPVHLSIGQEATAAGVCLALRQQDLVVSNHRSHGHYVAKGASLRSFYAELYGKATGCSGGVGGSMHLVDQDAGFLVSIPIVGGSVPIAVGAALANQMQGKDLVTVVFHGDAVIEEGVFHESLNFAIVKNLPIIFFCENNFYSVYTHLSSRQPDRKISDLVRGYGLPVYTADGTDVLDVYRASKAAYNHVFSGKGPVFIEAETYRYREHCGPSFDNHIGYRTEAEYQEWRKKDPLEKLERHLLEDGIASVEEIAELRAAVLVEIEDAVNFAKRSPFPAPDQLFANLYPSDKPATKPSRDNQ